MSFNTATILEFICDCGIIAACGIIIALFCKLVDVVLLAIA
jgi:hypothetical protein